MKIRQVKKTLYDDYYSVETFEFNKDGLVTRKQIDSVETNYTYDTKNKLVRVDTSRSTDDPNEADIKILVKYEYDDLDFVALEYKTHSRPLNSDWYPNKQLLSIREATYKNGNVILDKKTYLRKFNSIEYTKYRYNKSELIYKEVMETDGTYVIEKYEGQKLIYKEQKFQYHNDDKIKIEIIKTEYSYDDAFKIIEEKEFLNDSLSKKYLYTYSDLLLLKKETYYPNGESELLDSYLNYNYDSKGNLLKVNTYQLYNGKFYLVKYEEFMYDNRTMEHTTFRNESYEWYTSMTSIQFGLCNTDEYWLNFEAFGDSITEPEAIESYKNDIAQMFSAWDFNSSSKSIKTFDYRKNIIKEEVESKSFDYVSNSTTINHFEYNGKGDLEFQVSFYNGFITEILKNYYSY